NLSIKEKLLKNIFVAGLNPKNQLVAEECGKYLPLEGLVKLLTMNEIRAKHDPPPPYHP
ncbi:6120_t:CDS:1, partial [Diversispora eburnea]